jgi:hypothetical protein
MRATALVSVDSADHPIRCAQVNFDLGFLRQTGHLAPLEEGRPGQP